MFIGLNPSTADASKDDNTSRVCINYAKRWGYGGLLLGNLYAYRSTDPSGIRRCDDPVGPENDCWLKQMQDDAGLVVCSWTSAGKYLNRDSEVLSFLRNPHCLVRLKDGSPGHPLYKSSTLRPIKYVVGAET